MKSSAAYCLALVVLISIAILSAGPAVSTASAQAADGQAIFLAQKCNLCHSVDSAGIQRTSKSEKTKGPDLGGVTKRHDAEWIKRWLNKQEQLNGKKHLTTFKGTPQELDTLIAWLSKQ
jgi:hypothetical protein